MTLFDWIIWSGAALTLIGLGALVWCIWTVGRARARGLDDAALREKMRGVLAVNMGALAVENPVIRSKLRRIRLYNEYFESPNTRSSCSTITSAGLRAKV